MRPRILDDTKRREVFALVSTGCSLNAAARYVGCSTRTIRREALRNPEFLDQLRQAEVTRQVGPLRALRRAAETNWRAAAWLLERGDPDQFSHRKPDVLSPGDIEALTTQFIDLIRRSVRQQDDLDRVLAGMYQIERQIKRDDHAISQPLRDPRRRRRDPTVSLMPPPDAPIDAASDAQAVAPNGSRYPQKLDATPGAPFRTGTRPATEAGPPASPPN